jgi:hypothetical protein
LEKHCISNVSRHLATRDDVNNTKTTSGTGGKSGEFVRDAFTYRSLLMWPQSRQASVMRNAPKAGTPDRDVRLILVPFDIRESMSIAMAAKFSGKAGNTIRLWAERYGIGRKIGGDWHISRVALRIFLDGDTAALAAYHAGERTNSLVRPYFERVRCGALLQKSQNYQNSQNQIGEARQIVAMSGSR